jgi:hypothetical protein
MQVVEVALLKYEHVRPYDQQPCAAFQNELSTSLVKQDTALVQILSRYRLQLSDGKNLVAAKFYPENVRLSQKQTKRVSNIHELVADGQIKKGTILSFVPNSHAQSGKGIASIFDFQVEGWDEIIGEPTPCHPGVASFSPSDMHHCTVPLSFTPMEPLPQPILLLAKLIEQHCGYCVIAGSSPLAHHAQNRPGCQHCYASRYSPQVAKVCGNAESNDVDLFVPQFPKGLAHFQETGEKIAEHGKTFYGNRRVGVRSDEGFLNDILKELHEKHGLRHTEIICTEIKLSGVEEGGEDYGWMRVFVGLKQKIEFQLVASTGIVLDKPFQILVMNTFPSSPDQPWSERVTDDFDVDIAKGIAYVDDDKAMLKKIAFPDSVFVNVLFGKFNYVIRPCHSFKQIWKRLKKYKSRGYELLSLTFDPRVSVEWKEHILTEFQIMCARNWIHDWEEAFGIHLPGDGTVAKHILSFVKGAPEYRYSNERKIEKRDMLRAMVFNELESSNMRDPGNVEVERLFFRDMETEPEAQVEAEEP